MGDICTCEVSSSAKWPVLRHGVQHVDSTALILASSVEATFVSVVLFTRDFHGPVHLHALRYHDFCAEVGVRAIFLTTFVGLSVDYIVLVAILSGDPRQKVEKALMHVDSAVFNRAMTTLAVRLFLLPCWIFFFPVGLASPRELHFLRLLLISFYKFLVYGLRPHKRVHQENGSEAEEAAC